MGTVWLTALISIAFMMRNTAVIGWIPLLAIKVVCEGSLLPFIMSALVVAIPIMAGSVAVDTWYYNSVDGSSDWVLTAYNFVQVNVVHSLSKYFGEDPAWWYMGVFAPAIFTVLYPFVLAAHYN